MGYDDDEMLERELYETDSQLMVSALLDVGIGTSPIPVRKAITSRRIGMAVLDEPFSFFLMFRAQLYS